MLKNIISILIFFVSLNSYAQELDKGSNKNVLLTQDYIVGVNFNTRGWGFVFDYSKQKHVKYKHTYGVVISNIRHQKEFKLIGTSGSKGYYYGKINSLVSLRLTYGGNYQLYKSSRENGIEIQYKWKIGPSFGLVKPVYLEIDKASNGFFDQYSERYDPAIHFPGSINSRSSWFKGLGGANIQMGAFLKTGFDFNFSAFRTGISGGEVGIMVDYFPFKKIEIMYQEQDLSLFMAFYLQFNLGNKF